MVTKATNVSNNPNITSAGNDHDEKRWSGIIGAGQSLAVGIQAPLSEQTAPALGGLRLQDAYDVYDIERPDSTSLHIVGLTEPVRKLIEGICFYPANIDGKTPHSSMAAQIAALNMQNTKRLYTTVHTLVGASGSPMWDICKGGNLNLYAASLFEAKALTRLATEADHTLEYDCIVMTHGETDAVLNHTEYAEELIKLLGNYTEDLKEITGQEKAPIMILSQQQASPPAADAESALIQAQWRVQSQSSNTIICACPKYQYAYADGLHLPAGGYDRLGEKYGQVFYQSVIEKKPFIPLSPKFVSLRDPTTILVSFNIPVAPLVWNEAIPMPHQTAHTAWSLGRGFEVRDSRKREIIITDVRILPNNELEIDLAQPPRHLPLTLSYAMTAGREGFAGGCADGRTGQLCDSDPLVGVGAESLECEVTTGSCEIFNKEGFKRRTMYDRIMPEDVAIVEFDKERSDRAMLSTPWGGVSGQQKLFFQHDQRNYLVSFVLPVEQKSPE